MRSTSATSPACTTRCGQWAAGATFSRAVPYCPAESLPHVRLDVPSAGRLSECQTDMLTHHPQYILSVPSPASRNHTTHTPFTSRQREYPKYSQHSTQPNLSRHRQINAAAHCTAVSTQADGPASQHIAHLVCFRKIFPSSFLAIRPFPPPVSPHHPSISAPGAPVAIELVFLRARSSSMCIPPLRRCCLRSLRDLVVCRPNSSGRKLAQVGENDGLCCASSPL